MNVIRMAVVGAGQFGRHHMRVIRDSAQTELAAVVDTDPARAEAAAAEFGGLALTGLDRLPAIADAAVVAVPTLAHAETGCALLEMGLDVLVEKPIADTLEGARRLIANAEANRRVLQVGHLERFNPVVSALTGVVNLPLFFEIHRMSVFSPRSLDVDVVLDLMVHDIDIVLNLVKQMPEEVRAAGVSILSEKVDIANVRLAFPGGCVANLTASRVSTEKVRKLRLFQPHQYISVDYSRQDSAIFTVSETRQIGMSRLPVERQEPLRLELESFFECVRTRRPPLVPGEQGLRALEVALAILDRIEVHSRLVQQTLAEHSKR